MVVCRLRLRECAHSFVLSYIVLCAPMTQSHGYSDFGAIDLGMPVLSCSVAGEEQTSERFQAFR